MTVTVTITVTVTVTLSVTVTVAVTVTQTVTLTGLLLFGLILVMSNVSQALQQFIILKCLCYSTYISMIILR